MMSLTVPVKNGRGFFFLDAHRWGTGYGNIVNLWVRKVDERETGKSFTVGRVHMAVRTVDPGPATCEQTASY